MASRSKLLGQLFFLSISVTGGGLGAWQVKRYYWKVSSIEDAKSQFENANIVDINDIESQSNLYDKTRELLGSKARLTGKYIKDHDVFLGLRSAPLSKNRNAAQGLAVNPQGYYVYTPFEVSSSSSSTTSKSIIFVNRGWVPMKFKQVYTPDEILAIEGIVVKGEKVSVFIYICVGCMHVVCYVDVR